MKVPCDAVVENIGDATDFINNFFSKPNNSVKGIEVLDEALQYYKDNHYKNDQYLLAL